MTTDNLSMDEAAEKLGDISGIWDDDAEEEEQEAEAADDADKAASDDADDADDDEASSEDADEDDEEEDDDEGEDEDPVISWETKSGEKVEVSLSELKNGFMRTRDYTQKTQEAAEIKRKSEAAEAEFRTRAEKLEATLTEWVVNQPQEPDWVKLAQENPQAYVQQRAQWDQYHSRAEQAREELGRLQQDAQAERVRQAEAALLQDFPQWADPEVAKKDGAELLSAANEFGFSKEEFSKYIVEEPRIAKVLIAAGKFNAMKNKPANIEKRVSKPGKTLRPGPKTTAKQSVSRKAKEANQRFRQEPSMENAMKALDGVDLF